MAGFYDLLTLCGVTAGGKVKTTTTEEGSGRPPLKVRKRLKRERERVRAKLSAEVMAIVTTM